MMSFMSHKGIGLGLGDLLVLLGFPDKLRKRCGIANSRWHLYLLEEFKSFFRLLFAHLAADLPR